MTDHFDSIRHFNQQELPAAIQEIFSDERVIRVLDQYGYGLSVEELKKVYESIPPTSPINRARRAAIMQQILKLMEGGK